MEQLRIECLKIASDEAVRGILPPDAGTIFERAEELLAWVVKDTKHEPAPPESEYERLPGAVAR